MERIIACPLIHWALGSGAVLMAPIKIVSAGSLPDRLTSHVFFNPVALAVTSAKTFYENTFIIFGVASTN